MGQAELKFKNENRAKFMKTYHHRQWLQTRFTEPLCGAPSFVDYGTTQRDRVTCSACLALLEPVAAPEPVEVAVRVQKKRAKPESIQQQLI